MSKVLTSVKVEPDVYNRFKQNTKHTKFHLQDLVNRSMHLFLNDSSTLSKLESFVSFGSEINLKY